MKVVKYFENDQLTVAVEGRIDTLTAPDLEKELTLGEVKELLFDFSKVEYISSAGLRVLVRAYKQMAAANGTMKLAGVQPIVKEVFDITGFADTFTFI